MLSPRTPRNFCEYVLFLEGIAVAKQIYMKATAKNRKKLSCNAVFRKEFCYNLRYIERFPDC